MANEFIARKGLRALEDSQITGSLSISNDLSISGTGSFTGPGIKATIVDGTTIKANRFVGDGRELFNVPQDLAWDGVINDGLLQIITNASYDTIPQATRKQDILTASLEWTDTGLFTPILSPIIYRNQSGSAEATSNSILATVPFIVFSGSNFQMNATLESVANSAGTIHKIDLSPLDGNGDGAIDDVLLLGAIKDKFVELEKDSTFNNASTNYRVQDSYQKTEATLSAPQQIAISYLYEAVPDNTNHFSFFFFNSASAARGANTGVGAPNVFVTSTRPNKVYTSLRTDLDTIFTSSVDLHGNTEIGYYDSNTHTIKGKTTFTGNITASGNISASSDIITNNLQGNGNITGFTSMSVSYITASQVDVDGDTIRMGGEIFNKTLLQNVKDGFDSNTRNDKAGVAAFKAGIQTAGNITASGNISASGTSTGSFGHLEIGNIHLSPNSKITSKDKIEDTYIQMISDTAFVINANGIRTMGISSQGVTFNENGSSQADFRVESDNNTHAFFVDSGNNKVAIGTDTVSDSLLTVNGDISSSGAIYANRFGDNLEIIDDGNATTLAIDSAAGESNSQFNLAIDGTTKIELNKDALATYFSGNTVFNNPITASGDISASGNIVSNTLNVDNLFESSTTGSILPNVYQNIFDTGSATLGSNGGSIGDIVKFGNSATIAGTLYYLGGDGQWASAQANAVGTATSSLAMALGLNSTTDGMLLKGFINPSSMDATAAIGSPLYMSDTHAGRTQGSAPSSTGDIVRIVGYKYGADLIYFNPSNDYIVHA